MKRYVKPETLPVDLAGNFCDKTDCVTIESYLSASGKPAGQKIRFNIQSGAGNFLRPENNLHAIVEVDGVSDYKIISGGVWETCFVNQGKWEGFGLCEYKLGTRVSRDTPGILQVKRGDNWQNVPITWYYLTRDAMGKLCWEVYDAK